MSDEGRVMPAEVARDVTPERVTPSKGKGALGRRWASHWNSVWILCQVNAVNVGGRRAGGITMRHRGVCGRALNPPFSWEGPPGKAAVAANRTREIRPSGMRGGPVETWAMAEAKRARTAETPKQPSLNLMSRAPRFYPTP